MITYIQRYKRMIKIVGYSVFVVMVFTFSLILLPLKFFFVPAFFVLVVLREVEKEVKRSEIKRG